MGLLLVVVVTLGIPVLATKKNLFQLPSVAAPDPNDEYVTSRM
jgi:hypothetical protein